MAVQVRHNPAMPILPVSPRFHSLQWLACALVLALATSSVQAQDAEPAADKYAPATGDAWVDQHLADINAYAARYPQAFTDELSRYYRVPRGYVLAMLQQSEWQAGDVFMACAVAVRLSQPCRAVVREWSRDHAEGWAGVAERLQLDPDSPEFRALREDVTASYRRWARPLIEVRR